MLSFLFFTQQQHEYKEKGKQTFKAVLSSMPNERHSFSILRLFSLAWNHCRLSWGRGLLGGLRKLVHRKSRNPQREDALEEGSSYKMEVLSTQSLWVSDSFGTPWTVARQAPLSIGLPRQECWSGLPFSSPGDLPHPGIELKSLVSPAYYIS